MSEVIEFYGVTDEYGWCSNFARFAIQLHGKRWPTTEHFFQAQKFEEAESQEEIRQAKTPMIAARMGRERTRKPRRDWESVKVAVMREALRAKFQQHEELARQLLATGEAKLVEHTGNDNYWGDGGDGRGQNMLGRLLMEIREELRKA
jgi:N-glycosidase YbiA